MEGDNSEEHYTAYTDSQMNAELVDTVTREKGYFIYPSQLFAQVVGTAESNPNLNTELAAIFTAIEASAVGYASERAVKFFCRLLMRLAPPEFVNCKIQELL